MKGLITRMRFPLLSLLAGGALALASPSVPARDGKTGLLTRAVSVNEKSYSYQVYVPSKARQTQKLPVIIFLHGIGQRGEGGFIPSGGAMGAMVRNYLERVPAIILLPQCAKGVYWSDPSMERLVMASLDQTVKEFGADNERLYLTGVSMGGYGAWHVASQHPDTFAAIVAICGGSPLRTGERFASIARRIGKTPVWVFHGSDDRVVPVSESRQMVAALKAQNGNVRYSEYAGVGHNVWLNVLKEKELLPWLLAQHRTK
jgi:predicted peptidase